MRKSYRTIMYQGKFVRVGKLHLGISEAATPYLVPMHVSFKEVKDGLLSDHSTSELTDLERIAYERNLNRCTLEKCKVIV